ncbi:MAG: hypothetical protein RMJ59_02865 [Candidatus Nitrosocaldus sp.]|nr:hypothetical protein [Candidatus Nitrosocaldus sp.]
MNRFNHLYIYMLSGKVNHNSILAYITDVIDCSVECRGADALYSGFSMREIAWMHAMCRVRDVFKATSNEAHAEEGDVEHELSILRGYANDQSSIYDGFMLQSMYSSMIDPEESSLEHVHVILTDRLIATYREEDMRYHLNTVVLGYPSIVSISGIVEAPAKPRAFYTLYYYYISQGITVNMDELKHLFRDAMLDHDDPRLTDAVKGYIMHAVFYSMLNDSPFCDEKGCMLYNSHWQDEVIQAQVSGGMCERHRAVLKEFNGK